MMQSTFTRFKPWVMWFLPLSFFAYQFILRLWPSLTMTQIMQQFHIDATSFGVLAAMYYFGYAGMQIPVAILIDRYGVRGIIALFALIGSGATYLFVHTDVWPLALMGRFFIGFASAAGFLGTSKAVSLWFPQNRYARMIGLTFSFGLLGAVYGGKPVNALIESMGFREMATLLAIVSLGISVLIFLLFRNPAKPVEQETLQVKSLKQILMNPSLIVLAIANLLMVGALEGFADVWGVPYLIEAYKMPKTDAAGFVSYIFYGMLVGGPVLAFLSEKWGNIQVISLCGIGIAASFFAILFLCAHIDTFALRVLFFLIGIFCCYQVIVFSTSTTLIPIHLLGITIAFLNSINMFGGSFFHSLIGVLVDRFWTGGFENGCRVYTSESYTYGLLIIPLCALVGALLVQWIPHKAAARR
jgi:MFS family permease